MADKNVPCTFRLLTSDMCIENCDIVKSSDGFFMVNRSLESILSKKGIFDFPDASGRRLECSKFFDDWFLYAVSNEKEYVYSLLKLREQEHDAEGSSLADGDTPGVTISFISFDCSILLSCLEQPTDENRMKLDAEIDRVVARRGQRHNGALKRYFEDPRSVGAYIIADAYIKHIASFAENGRLPVPERYREIVQQSIVHKHSKKLMRIPSFIDILNQSSEYVVCDNENIFIKNREEPSCYEAAAILATHTGNTSFFSFAAEVEYHARFLTPLAKIKIPFLHGSVYDSAIRADMTIGDNEFEGPAPFHRSDSKIVKRQYELHGSKKISEYKNIIS